MNADEDEKTLKERCLLSIKRGRDKIDFYTYPGGVSERLKTIRTYLETIGKRNQEQWQRLSEREPAFARMDAAVIRLKTYCEKRMLKASDDSFAYGFLRYMLFGVEWDPEHYFQVTVSLLWQQQHSTLAEITAACKDAWVVLHGEDKVVSAT